MLDVNEDIFKTILAKQVSGEYKGETYMYKARGKIELRHKDDLSLQVKLSDKETLFCTGKREFMLRH